MALPFLIVSFGNHYLHVSGGEKGTINSGGGFAGMRELVGEFS